MFQFGYFSPLNHLKISGLMLEMQRPLGVFLDHLMIWGVFPVETTATAQFTG